MTGIRRQKKKYSRPRKAFETERISEENAVIKKYGLKNKREIWKAEAQVARLRNIAKSLITASDEEQESFISKLVERGFLSSGSKIDNVLDMKREDYLSRRLQTVVHKKGFGRSPKHARQMVTHRFIRIKDRIVTVPSYIVDLKEEKLVTVKAMKAKAAPKPMMEEKQNESKK
ncbi:30S ribosomal protein S4 [Nanoarchaeota archaeon]